jgi:hypothetical protein
MESKEFSLNNYTYIRKHKYKITESIMWYLQQNQFFSVLVNSRVKVNVIKE